MNNIYFMCENCGIETNGITFVNGMKFCAKCYHQIFGKDNQQTEITQLKQQLAEKQNEIAELEQDLEFTTKTANELIEIKHKLEQELAELKSKYENCENERLQNRMDYLTMKNKWLNSEKKLAELKEKAIVVPVKLGDTIYVVPSKTNYEINIINKHKERNKVYEYVVSEIRYNKYGYSVVCELDNIPFYFNYERAKRCCEHFDTEKFYGETWFTTEQEAQAKLKEIQGNE